MTIFECPRKIGHLLCILCSSLIYGLAAEMAFAGHELFGRDIQQGVRLYQEHCAACHGVALEGQPNWRRRNDDGTYPAPPHDETGHTWHHDNAFLFNYTKLGGAEVMRQMEIKNFQSGMEGFANTLTDDEIWNILGYIRSTWSSRAQKFQNSKNLPH